MVLLSHQERGCGILDSLICNMCSNQEATDRTVWQTVPVKCRTRIWKSSHGSFWTISYVTQWQLVYSFGKNGKCRRNSQHFCGKLNFALQNSTGAAQRPRKDFELNLFSKMCNQIWTEPQHSTRSQMKRWNDSMDSYNTYLWLLRSIKKTRTIIFFYSC